MSGKDGDQYCEESFDSGIGSRGLRNRWGPLPDVPKFRGGVASGLAGFRRHGGDGVQLVELGRSHAGGRVRLEPLTSASAAKTVNGPVQGDSVRGSFHILLLFLLVTGLAFAEASDSPKLSPEEKNARSRRRKSIRLCRDISSQQMVCRHQGWMPLTRPI
jgi:hypothetical protein